MVIKMKRIMRILTLMVIVACSVNFILFTKEAKAEVKVNVPVQVVDEVDNYPYPDTTTIYYDNDWKSNSSFTISTAGQLKAVFHCQMDSDITGNIWLSSDIYGRSIIGEITKISGNLTEVSWFLESGTYYINTNMIQPTTKVLIDGRYYVNATVSATTPILNMALLFEGSRVIELDPTSSFESSYPLQYNNTAICFLTNMNPVDYYTFNLTKKASVTFKYSFDTSAAANDAIGYCGVYDSNELLLKEGTYTNTSEATQEFTYLLEPGTYFVKLNGMLGNSTLKIEPKYCDISLTAVTKGSWTKKHIHVNIDTSIDYSDIIVLYKDVKDTLLDNNVMWSKTNKAYVELDGESFIAKKSGTYSVRITDQYGNNTMKKIKISNIDVTAPKIKGVTDSKSYKKSVTLTWTDTQSGINKNKATLNGKVVSSGTKITKEGKYTLKVYDKIGNCKTVEFCIDHTAPTANVQSGKTYTDYISLKFKDNVSGIEKIVVDGVELSTTNYTMYCYLDGEYTIELWDKAGNYKKYEFTIRKD